MFANSGGKLKVPGRERKILRCQKYCRYYEAFTLDVIASSAFSTKIDSHNNPDNEFVQAVRNLFSKNVNWKFLLFFMFPGLTKFFRNFIFGSGPMEFFSDVTRQIIKDRKRTGKKANDFLQLLLDTATELNTEEISDNYERDVTQAFKIKEIKTLSMDELVAQCVVFFIAGYDTTASTLSYASYLLALNPDKQDRLRSEIDDVLDNFNEQCNYDAIQEMKYLDNVISETLRLFPPGVRLERVADADYKLGNTGIIVPKGMLITIPSYAIHRDSKFYPNPDKFEPERFIPEERAKRDQYAYLPFGAGPRNCVGMRFALMEIKVCLAHVIAHFVVKTCPQTKVPLDFHRSGGLLQPKGIVLDLELRYSSRLRK